MKLVLILAGLLCFATGSECIAQHQLVLIKNDRVQIRYQEGDKFVYQRKRSKEKISAFIVEINDTTLITTVDTVATHQIARIYFKQGNFLNVMGRFLIMGGTALFLVDQINELRVGEASLNSRVNRISLTSVAIGIPLVLLTKKTHRVGFRQRLRIINRDSPFYYSESRFIPKGYVSPHIPRN